MAGTLWSHKYYTAPIDYLNSTFIREYDISKADISVLLSKGQITQEQFNFLYRIPSINRNVYMGILQRDNPKLKKILSNGIEEVRKLFFEANDIEDSDVLSIKNDAIFLINKVASVTTFGNVTLKEKNTYTSFYKLPKKYNKEFYYYVNRVTGEESLEIKGISDDSRKLHEEYFVDFLLVLFNSIELFPISDTIDLIQTFYNQYINMELPLGYYRKFDQFSGFDTNLVTPILKHKYILKYLSEEHREMIDISYNLSIILELYRMVSTMYFSSTRQKK